MGALPEEDQSSRVMLLSADCHAGPRVEQFREFLDPEFRQAFDEYAAAVSVLEEAPLHTSDDLAEATRDNCGWSAITWQVWQIRPLVFRILTPTASRPRSSFPRVRCRFIGTRLRPKRLHDQ